MPDSSLCMSAARRGLQALGWGPGILRAGSQSRSVLLREIRRYSHTESVVKHSGAGKKKLDHNLIGLRWGPDTFSFDAPGQVNAG